MDKKLSDNKEIRAIFINLKEKILKEKPEEELILIGIDVLLGVLADREITSNGATNKWETYEDIHSKLSALIETKFRKYIR